VDRIDEDVRGADDTQRRVAAIPGSQGLYYLVDRDTGHTMSITLWESEQAMRDSDTAASQLREVTSSAVGAKVVSIERYEVVVQPAQVPAGRM
jgi:heme-degrading monooxygenase HmoA